MHKEYLTTSDLISIRQAMLHMNSVSIQLLVKNSPVYNRIVNAKNVISSLDELLNPSEDELPSFLVEQAS